MADVEDKEKAEKLAAAKKRFEQLKKQQQKGKKASKKKEDKSEDAEVKDDKEDTVTPDTPAESVEKAEPVASDEAPTSTTTEETTKAAEETTETDDTRPEPTRKPSQAAQSRQRSESFRQGVAPAALKSPGLSSINAEDEAQDVYRKQVARIEELEKENTTLKETQAGDKDRLQKTEEELERMRESSADVAELKSKAATAEEQAKEIEKLKSELASVQRQLTQAQQSATTSSRRKSNASPSRELSEQLAFKTSAVESLELELSNLRNQYNMSQSSNSSHEATIRDLQQRATTAETSATTTQKEMETLRESMSKDGTSTAKDEDSDPVALQKKITLLESDLRTAQSSADSASQRATSLEQKIEALTKLHKDTNTTASSREKEISDLKTRLASLEITHKRNHSDHDADETFDELVDAEREKLHTRIRDLEAENFDLRRGVWRDKRAALQPSMTGAHDTGDTSPGYEDVDLNGSSNPYATSRPTASRVGSSFQDIVASGISAFTGRDSRRTVDAGAQQSEGQGRPRGQSLGLLSEEGMDFDEDAFRVAQEEEARKRVERIREVKKGLEQWRGWRVDLVDLRAGGLGRGLPTGPTFDV